GVVVVGRAAQHRAPLVDADDAGQRPLLARGVADDAHVVADDDPAPAEFAGPHRGHQVVAQGAGVAAAVAGDHEAVLRLVMARPGAGAGARPTAGADAYVVLVVVALPLQCAPPSTIWLHSSGNSGIVFDVQATSESTMPGTASPITAAAWAIRWSA